jgi:membrane-bound lytic murein transglycosylase D
MEEHVLIAKYRSIVDRAVVRVGIAAVALALSACSTPPTASPAAQAPGVGTPTEVSTQTPTPVPADKVAPQAAAASDPIASLAAGQPIDDLRPEVKVNLDDKAAQEAARKDLWQRLRDGLVMSNLETDLVRQQEQW